MNQILYRLLFAEYTFRLLNRGDSRSYSHRKYELKIKNNDFTKRKYHWQLKYLWRWHLLHHQFAAGLWTSQLFQAQQVALRQQRLEVKQDSKLRKSSQSKFNKQQKTNRGSHRHETNKKSLRHHFSRKRVEHTQRLLFLDLYWLLLGGSFLLAAATYLFRIITVSLNIFGKGAYSCWLLLWLVLHKQL